LMSASFENHQNSDGVAFSVDGITWHRIISLTGTNSTDTYQEREYNLSSLATAAGVALGADVRVRFQQYGYFPFTNDGILFDSISATGTVAATTVSVAANDSLAAEGASNNGQFTVKLADNRVAPAGGITVNYTVGGTAEGTTDYGALSGSVTIPEGQNSATIDVSGIVDDGLVEGDETVSVTLTGTDYESVTVADAPDDAATVNIQDNDAAAVAFQLASSATANEAAANHGVVAVLSVPGGGTLSSALTVQVASSNGTATAGSDYTPVATTLTFAAGSGNGATQTVNVPILADTSVEGNETLTLTLSSPQAPLALGAQTTHGVTITDDDVAGVTITESGDSTSVSEAGLTDTYTIALATVPAGAVEITVTANAQLLVSTDGTNFFSSRVLSFTDQTPQTITVKAVDDAVAEGTHTGMVSHAVTGTVNDPNYPLSLTIDGVTASITDNDTTGEIQGVKFHDQDGDGIKDAEEPGLQGWTIFLDADGDGILDAGELSEVTDSGGSYAFTGLAAGTYRVAEVIQSGWVPTFSAKTPAVIASKEPTDMALADIDRDSDLDALIVIPASDAVVPMTNDGGGGFARINNAAFFVSDRPVAIAVGDFDGQEGPDFATAAEGGYKIDILFNNGTGGFGSLISLGTDVQPDVVSAGRFASDNDGDLDLFTGLYSLSGADGWRVYENKGSEGFALSLSETTSSVDGPRDSVVGDFNGDLLDDVAVAYWNSDNVLIVLNGATGLGSGGTRLVSVGDVPTGLAAADFDGNSHLDLVTANRDSNDVTVVLNQGGANFASGVSYAAGTTAVHAATGDFNRDGFPDLVVANREANSISLLMNRGNGTFATPIAYAVGNKPETVAAADVNGDGVDDMLAVNKDISSRTLSVFLSTAGRQTVDLASGQVIAGVNLGNRQFQAPSVTIRQTDGGTQVTEGAPAGDSYEVFLNTLPTSDVTVTVTPDAQLDLGAGAGVAIQLTFTEENGVQPQPVYVTAVDDDVVEGPHAGTLTHSAASADEDYDGIVISNVVVQIADNDGTLLATFDNGTLTVTDRDPVGKPNQLTVTRNAAELVISDASEQFDEPAPAGALLSNDNRMLTIPLSSVSALAIGLAAGNDALTVDFSGGNPIPADGLSF
ncbi:MAG TPA: Calx-beta domain-containing protein, partial [Candidatus Anammoximicrobium sp.]|nr:Calx-beta domain-containing protein [Candidatus Anammoximicrobium sp.]